MSHEGAKSEHPPYTNLELLRKQIIITMAAVFHCLIQNADRADRARRCLGLNVPCYFLVVNQVKKMQISKLLAKYR